MIAPFLLLIINRITRKIYHKKTGYSVFLFASCCVQYE
ncbi:hypothetical protein SB48_HM08orf01868 [Heyndrickxia coagulans]|uniref:Uncharacterized protein n=1 Tax=Heyndrickxia coagulans TaxID=1398 RepID=A0AAN0WBA6_HEYCO|nr:hypothetical protein SB48_HM08orf01868 [Heyndrickxia coagulans]KYC67005.1 hypothetical protein B4100_2483 [Heyndrickxia coagulans]